ncbi:hypothetical protein [Corynebacterium pseudokroppenstedtii]|nr:hypothetical protein [Corynebacterium pseudokroppenstedtii]MDU6478701.1 hypothetical protein [Corynebacterium kroppenstedtii]
METTHQVHIFKIDDVWGRVYVGAVPTFESALEHRSPVVGN